MNDRNLKRISIITLSIIMSIGMYGLKNSKKSEVISTMSVPVTNKVIVIDAGHGR